MTKRRCHRPRNHTANEPLSSIPTRTILRTTLSIPNSSPSISPTLTFNWKIFSPQSTHHVSCCQFRELFTNLSPWLSSLQQLNTTEAAKILPHRVFAWPFVLVPFEPSEWQHFSIFLLYFHFCLVGGGFRKQQRNSNTKEVQREFQCIQSLPTQIHIW